MHQRVLVVRLVQWIRQEVDLGVQQAKPLQGPRESDFQEEAIAC